MEGVPNNPYALYVHCDAAMDYDSKNTGGVGLKIEFPDFVELESIEISIGRYEGANIERLELSGILRGMEEVTRLFNKYRDKLKNINTIIITTDRFGLSDEERTNPYRIKEWRKRKWCNYEGRAIKNSDLLEKIDKTRTKIIKESHCKLVIEYQRRKYNKDADKLAKLGKKQELVKENLALHGLKVGKRKYSGEEINYENAKEGERYIVHVFKKERVRDQWEIDVEFSNGYLLGRKMKIYSDFSTQEKMHRSHTYEIKIKKVFSYHVTIFDTIKEIK